MGILVALTVGLIIWIVGWSFGMAGIDPLLPLFGILALAAAGRLLSPYLKQRRL